MSLSEQEKIKIAKSAFAKFKIKIDELFKKQNGLFERIMERITEKKIREHREKLGGLYNKNNQ